MVEARTVSLDGGTGEAGRRGHDRRCLQVAQQHIPRNTVFGSDPRGAETVIGALKQKGMEDPGGAAVATDLSNAHGSMSRQCALEAVRIQMLGMLCTQWEIGSTTVRRGARLVARRARSGLFASRFTQRCWKQGRRPRMDKTTRRKGR